MKKRIKVPAALRSRLQQEIHSECPFCTEKQVETFELHHMNGNPSDNVFENLIMLCPTCHTKIDKSILTAQQVKDKKNQLVLKSAKVELASIVVDDVNCSWHVREENAFAFYHEISPKSPFPLFNFTFLNHARQTIILKSIKANYRFLSSGLSGPPSGPGTLKPLIKYHIQLNYNKDQRILHLVEPLFIPDEHPALFQVEFSEGNDASVPLQIDGRIYIDLVFVFNDSVEVKAPRIFLNCQSENPKTKLVLLG